MINPKPVRRRRGRVARVPCSLRSAGRSAAANPRAPAPCAGSSPLQRQEPAVCNDRTRGQNSGCNPPPSIPRPRTSGDWCAHRARARHDLPPATTPTAPPTAGTHCGSTASFTIITRTVRQVFSSHARAGPHPTMRAIGDIVARRHDGSKRQRRHCGSVASASLRR